MSLPSPLYSLARRSLPSALAAACCKQQRRSTSRRVGHGSSFAAIASQSYGPKLTMPAPPAVRPRKNSLKTWRMPDRRVRQKSEVAAPRMSGDLFGCSLEWRTPYSSRNVFAGSMLAIRSVGTAVAISVTDASTSTTPRIVGTSYTRTP